MLSLLSLLLASGTVLRADTEEWSPQTYPDPRTNHTLCNTWPNSTLCDPDHILTDQWRSEINDNIIRQIEKLKSANILYTENAPPECHENTTEGVQIYIEFGDKLAEEYGLSDQICKNYLLLIGVEAAKMAYTRTGSSLKLPEDLMFRIYNQSENVFKEKNYMEGLNKMIDEIGDQMMDPFKFETTTPIIIETEATTEEVTTEDPSFNISSSIDLIWTEVSTTQASVKQTVNNPWWMFVCLGIAIFSTVIVLIMILISKRHTFKTLQMQTVIPVPNTITKSNCPSDDNNSDRFATITIPRRRIDLETEINNEEEKQQKIEINDEEADVCSQVTVASSEEHNYRVTEAITNNNNNTTIKFTDSVSTKSREDLRSPQFSLPKSPACFKSLGPVQINADHLSTDIVISYLSSSSCESEAEPQLTSPKSPNVARII
uniref:Uncharacterized protein n=1 Tax=Panagrolaimus sp. PS1159 TaxID=55785 RepID=A0AC35FUB0_9BILA